MKRTTPARNRVAGKRKEESAKRREIAKLNREFQEAWEALNKPIKAEKENGPM